MNCNELAQNSNAQIEQGIFKLTDDLDKIWEMLNLEKILENKLLEVKQKDKNDFPISFVENYSRPNQQEFSDNELSIINIRDTDNSISKVTLREDDSAENFDQNCAKNQADNFCNELLDWLLWINHNLNTQIVTIGNFEEIQQSINKYNVRKDQLFFQD